MPKVISNTSPLQYLHQLGLLHLLPALMGSLLIPAAVVQELEIGREDGVDVPDVRQLEWTLIATCQNVSQFPLIECLGAGEAETLALALEIPGAVVIIDDKLGRQVAQQLGIRLTGTLGILLDAKKAGYLPKIAPLVEQLQQFGFRLSSKTKQAILELAGE